MRELGGVADADDSERGRVWGLIVAIVVAVIGALAVVPREFQFVLPHLQTGDLLFGTSVSVGTSLVIALVVWVVLHFTFTRWRAPDAAFDYFLFLFAAVAVANLGTMWWMKGNLEAKAVAEQVQSQQTEARMDDFLRMQDSLASRINTAETSFRNKITTLGFPAFLNPEHIASDRTLSHARAKLQAAHTAINGFRKTRDGLIASYRQSVLASTTDAQVKSGYLAGSGSCA